MKNDIFKKFIKIIDLIEGGEFKTAEEELLKLSEEYPNNPLIYYLLGKVNTYKKFSKLLKFEKVHIPIEFLKYPKTTYDILKLALTPEYREAMLSIERGDYYKAIEDFKKLTKIDGEFVTPWLYKALLYEMIGDLENALMAINKVLELNKKDALAWYIKGRILRKLGRYNEALEALYNAITLDKNLVNVLKELGYTNLIIGDYKKALKWLNDYLKKVPNDPEALFYKAIAYKGLGKLEEALKILDGIIDKGTNVFIKTTSMLIKASILERLGKVEEAVKVYNEILKK
ncbi:TPR repeat-containing protein [Methanocaldococcus villosus KIN24-T80]|uniref:TPR repeat-containing protein n=1 Tax=Methanocaldococcus villosus KIN24-T80 TaxID=1069083 RepID=N6VTX1_9EURY|nr:tetratricopeptide repeat protein [Methanocaldococcus villosus]ENN96616.1 TPR repeat-containing protein [Methanocaldococcus villosus KIN24-T80]